MKKKKDYITESNLKELRNIIEHDKKEVTPIDKPILFDGRQYSIRIPKKFAESLKINPKKDLFRFELNIPEDKTKVPELKGWVIHG
jgi:hypothetical protein